MSNEMTESGAKAAGLNWATVALCILVAALAGFFLPRGNTISAQRIELVSPNRKNTITIEAGDFGSTMTIEGQNSGRIMLGASQPNAPTIDLFSRNTDLRSPEIILSVDGATDFRVIRKD